LDATQLVADAALCLLVPIALSREAGALEQLCPASVAIAFSGWNGKALLFPGFPRLTPRAPVDMNMATGPIFEGPLATPRDAMSLARQAVRGLARFYGQRGADAWDEKLEEQLRARRDFRGWLEELLV
jgi:hypothetical protein